MDRLTAAAFEALGLYDPAEAHAARKLELLEYLVGLGATNDDLVQHRDDLPGLATIVASRAGQPLTLAEAAQRAGVDEKQMLRIIRAAGFAEPGPDDRVIMARSADPPSPGNGASAATPVASPPVMDGPVVRWSSCRSALAS